MKKNKLQDSFFAELRKVPIVQVACEKTGVSRNSVYRWRKEDLKFSKNMDQALVDGVALVNDMTESQMLTMIKEKEWPAISFWLKHRNNNYKDKIEITTKKDTEELTPEQKKIVREALRLGTTIISDNQNKHEPNTNNSTKTDRKNVKGQESEDGNN